jgi:Ca2+-binding EF-hand superfamily protein
VSDADLDGAVDERYRALVDIVKELESRLDEDKVEERLKSIIAIMSVDALCPAEGMTHG